MRIGNMMLIGLFIGFLITGSIVTLFVHMSTASSETENRRLASFPDLTMQTVMSGTFFRQLENYTADHIGFRDSLVETSKLLSSLQGKSGSESALIVNSGANNSGEAQTATPVQNATNTGKTGQLTEPPLHAQQGGLPVKPPAAEEKGKVQGKVLVLGDRAMNLFAYDPASGQAYVDAINHIQTLLDQALPGKIQTTVLLAPTAVEFIQSPKLKSLSASQRKAIDEVYGKIRSDIAKVDALSAMKGHAQEELLHFRTDHHWTAIGAYYAYAAFVEAKGMTPVPLSAYEKGEVPDFLGSLYASTMNRGLAAHPDTIVYFKPFVEHRYQVHYTGSLDMPLIDLSHANKKNKYRIFLSGDRPWAQITTKANNNRKLLVIKDSYGNALVPFLLPHYSEIFVVDPRQFNQPLVPFVQKHGIQEMLVVNNAGVTADRSFAALLLKMMDI